MHSTRDRRDDWAIIWHAEVLEVSLCNGRG